MFKASALRQVRLCRIAGPNAGSALAAFRTTLRSTQTSSALNPTAPISYNGIGRTLRQYSHAAAETTSPAAHSQEPPRKLSKFSELGDLGVHDHVVSAITRGMKYEDMTDVQSATIHAALAGKDLVAQAKTGTGKTLAFLVPLVQKIIVDDEKLAHPRQGRARSDDIRAIIVSPTRELAEQIGQEARRLCRGTGVIVQTAVGGTLKASMLRKTRTEGCHLLVATPGRLYDLLNDPTSGIDAPNLTALVLDEADRMLDVGFDEELRNIVRLLPDRNETPRQTMLFSATIPKDVVQLARTYVDANNFEFVQTIKADDVPTHEKVPQFIVPVKGFENVFPTLLELINKELAAAKESHDGQPFKAIVFLPTAAMVRLAAGIFGRIQRSDRRKYPPALEIHSRLTQKARTQAADDFRISRSAILFSTDVTARGMDFPNVTHVIQCFNPSDREHYIHRIGRTGRAGKSGQAWLIVPELEVDEARKLLPGLPIQRATGFDSANYHLARQDAVNQPETFEPVFSVTQRLPDFLLEDAYIGAFGRIGQVRAQGLVDALNDWVRYGWGWEQPPAIPRKLASQRHLSRVRGIRIQDDEHRPPRRDAQFNSRDNRDNRISRGSRSDDPFNAVEEKFQDRRPRRSQRPSASF